MSVQVNKKIIIFLLIGCLIGCYFVFKKIKEKENEPRYILSQAEKGTIILTISGSGQISAMDQTEIRPKVSGEVEKVFVEKDQKVKKGDLLLKLKTKEFEKAIDDAKLALDETKTKLNILKENKKTAERDLNDTFDDLFNALSLTFNSLPSAMADIEKIFTESSYGGDQADIDFYRSVFAIYKKFSFPKNEKEEEFLTVNKKYQEMRDAFIFISRSSPKEVLEEWAKKTSRMLIKILDLVKSGRDIISLYKETVSKENLQVPISLSITNNQFSTLSQVDNTLNQLYSNLISLSKKIDQLKQSISNYENEIELQEKVVKQKEDLLEKARENYENCFILAQFDGKIAKINSKEGDLVSPSTVLFTLISEEKIAEISLNEIDAAKVKLGQKATLTFDAVPDLVLTGRVVEVDTVGTVSQGVVSYGIKIILDSDDERIKPSMSVTAEIIVDAKTNVLVLPNSAIKTQGNSKYVELVDVPEELKKQLKTGSQIILPKGILVKNQNVETGISNDTFTEIISGLKEGDIVILAKVSPQTAQTRTTQTQFRFQIPGMGGRVPR